MKRGLSKLIDIPKQRYAVLNLIFGRDKVNEIQSVRPQLLASNAAPGFRIRFTHRTFSVFFAHATPATTPGTLFFFETSYSIISCSGTILVVSKRMHQEDATFRTDVTRIITHERCRLGEGRNFIFFFSRLQIFTIVQNTVRDWIVGLRSRNGEKVFRTLPKWAPKKDARTRRDTTCSWTHWGGTPRCLPSYLGRADHTERTGYGGGDGCVSTS
jgi:hypothetical protein